MKILLFGMNGQVGWELQRSLAPLGEVISLARDSKVMCGDLADLDGIAQTIRSVAPDVIVNAAAYTAVDNAESEQDISRIVNASAPGVMAQQAQLTDALFVHYSTDYVFDGSGEQPRLESDATGPLGVYGTTKLAGEQLIQKSGCRHLIFRTSWVYGARGSNFAKTMLKLAQQRDTLAVVNDQFGAPTGAELLADCTAHAIRAVRQQPELAGLYHLVAGGETSWHGYASFVLECVRQSGITLKVASDAIQAVPTSAYPTPAQRPNNSRLDTTRFQDAFDLHLPSWQTGVARMLNEILDKQP